MFYCLLFLYYCLFFFKQKTAYEMRISDWSSDVCSSDLQEPDGTGAEEDQEQARLQQRGPGRTDRHPPPRRHQPADGLQPVDRKSVVSGKSVSVRVNLGGCRIIKKKQKEKKDEYNNSIKNKHNRKIKDNNINMKQT